MNKKTMTIFVFALVTFPFSMALAETNTTIKENIQQKRQEIKQERIEIKENIKETKSLVAQKRLEFQDRKEKMSEEKCKNIETKIATRTNRYENNKAMTEKVYTNMQARMKRLLTKLKSSGADTSKFETDLKTLDEKITKLRTDYSSFIATLTQTKEFVCGKSEGEFKNKLEEARKVPETIKQDREDIKNFFQNTIKADLEEIKNKLSSDTNDFDTPNPNLTNQEPATITE